MLLDAPTRQRPPATRRAPRTRTLALPASGDLAWLLGLAFLAVAVRVPFVGVPLGLDEAGYAFVAEQWGSGGDSLYGGQWVDRPPLLIALFAAAVSVGGDVGVRVLGWVCAVAIVVSCAIAGRLVAGRVAGRWAGVVALVLVSNPAWQGQTTNAELPAVAFVAASMAATLAAMGVGQRRWTAWRYGVLAGACAAAALLVKQSFADGAVFAVALGTALLAGRVRTQGDARRSLRAATLGGIVGVAAVGSLAAAWAATAGPGLGAMVDAVYVFRMEARAELQAFPTAIDGRRRHLLAVAATSGMFAFALVVAAGLVRGLAARATRPVAAALLVLLAFEVALVANGGNWWLHYLLQLVPALAVGAGVTIGWWRERFERASRPGSTPARAGHGWVGRAAMAGSLAWVGVVAILTWGYHVEQYAVHGTARSEQVIGSWLDRASGPGDTAFVTWGTPNVLWYSGLETPYEHLWSLPMRVRDPQLDELRAIVAGDEAPTWIVMRGETWYWDVDRSGRFRHLLEQRYDEVSSVCGTPVLLLREVARGRSSAIPPAPASTSCGSTPSIGDVPVLDHLA